MYGNADLHVARYCHSMWYLSTYKLKQSSTEKIDGDHLFILSVCMVVLAAFAFPFAHVKLSGKGWVNVHGLIYKFCKITQLKLLGLEWWASILRGGAQTLHEIISSVVSDETQVKQLWGLVHSTSGRATKKNNRNKQDIETTTTHK